MIWLIRALFISRSVAGPIGMTQLKVSSNEMTPILSMGRRVLRLARAASRAISIFGPLMLPDLSSTRTTAVGFSGGGSARTGSIFSSGVLGSWASLALLSPAMKISPPPAYTYLSIAASSSAESS